MSVGPPLVVVAKHYGSAYAMTDYITKATTAHINISFAPLTKLRLSGTLSYSKSEGALDEVVMPDVSARLDKDLTVDGIQPDLTHQDFSFTEMHTYSDLDYQLIRAGLGIEYRLSPKVSLTADGDYADLKDDQPYVYGNETGSFYMIRTGMKLEF